MRIIRPRGMFNSVRDGRLISVCSCGGCFTDTYDLKAGDLVQVANSLGMVLELKSGELIWVHEFSVSKMKDEMRGHSSSTGRIPVHEPIPQSVLDNKDIEVIDPIKIFNDEFDKLQEKEKLNVK